MKAKRAIMIVVGVGALVIGGLYVRSMASSVADSIAPLDDYTTASSKAIASKFRSRQETLLTNIASVFRSNEFRFLKTNESTVGGSGFWKNPTRFGSDDRFWGALALVVKPSHYIFGDNRDGRVASVFDKYGKTILDTFNKEMRTVTDPGVKGIAIGIIWSTDISTPTRGEGMLVFIKKADCLQYLNYKLTLQSLFNKSDLFLFSGPEELDTLTQFLLEV